METRWRGGFEGARSPESSEAVPERWHEALQALGAPVAAGVRRSQDIPAPQRAARSARAAAVRPRPLARFRSNEFERSPLPFHGPLGGRVDVRRARADHAVFLVRHLGMTLRSVGCAHRLNPTALLVDSRNVLSGMRPEERGWDWRTAVLFESGGVSVVDWGEAHVTRTAVGVPVPDSPSSLAPGTFVVGILTGDTCDPWLRREADRLGRSPRFLDRVVAVGLIGRLWMPDASANKAKIVERLMAGADHPPARARRHAVSLAPEMLDTIAANVLREAGRLRSAVRELPRSPPAAGRENLRRRVLALARRRDNLESVAFVLAAGERGGPLADALEAVDEEAGHRFAVLAAVGCFPDDDRLAAVSWQEPDAWWGVLGMPPPRGSGGS